MKAKSVGLYFVLLLYAGVIDFAKGHNPRPEVKHQGIYEDIFHALFKHSRLIGWSVRYQRYVKAYM